MVKDKEWLIKRLENYVPANERTVGGILDGVLAIAKQLDEPEVLSQKWIDKNKEPFHHFETNKVDYYVSADFLQNLLVPKQEVPVIPQFMARKLERYGSLQKMLVEEYYAEGTEEIYDDILADWIDKNFKTLCKAESNGYTVEEEQKYVIKLDDESYLQRYEIDNKNIVTPFRIVGHLKEIAIKFDNKERAEKVAELVEGEVEELEE